MKKLLAVSLTIMILGTLGGCGKQDTQEPPKVEIDYGNSELYTQEDMDAAIQVIEAEFATWEGCELHSLAYGGDAACSDENIEWLNGLEMKEQTEPFTQCIFPAAFTPPWSSGTPGMPIRSMRAGSGGWAAATAAPGNW